MSWNWQLSSWPKFTYDPDRIAQKEKKFLVGLGGAFAYLKGAKEQENNQFVVDILSRDGMESARIEGETLDRESLQSSIKRCFGLPYSGKKKEEKEAGMANLLYGCYSTFRDPLTGGRLCDWHAHLFKGKTHISDLGKYRTHPEPMQIVSSRSGDLRVFFEAPPSEKVAGEMARFIDWFNASETSPSILGRAAIAHVYFESIHPFEDGNGRIGRALIQKVLSQGAGQPVLIAVSTVLERRKKEYYAALERCNKSLEADSFVDFLSDAILEAQEESLKLLLFLIQKSKLMTALKINPRQEKVLLRLFEEGPNGFKGGLSAENYIAIAKASRATATRDLNELVELGALVKTGSLRYTRYWLNLPPLFLC